MKKKYITLPVSLLLVVLLAGVASAGSITCAFDQTATTVGTASSYLRPIASDETNLSITASGYVDRGDNASVMVLTNDITADVYVSNTSLGTNFTQLSNVSVDLSGILDTQTVTFTATVKNETQGTIATCTRAFIVDRTQPGCTFGTGLVSSDTYPPTQKWSITCGNADSATIQFGANSQLDMAEVNDVCTYTGSEATVPSGSYDQLSVRTNDGLNVTLCQLTSIYIDTGAPLKEVSAIIASQQFAKQAEADSSAEGSNNTMVMVLLILGAIWWFKYRK